MPPHQLPIFLLRKRGRVWRWSVCTAEGRGVMLGGESRRASARYTANRALFLMLLCTPYSYVHLRNGDSRADSHSGRSHSYPENVRLPVPSGSRRGLVNPRERPFETCRRALMILLVGVDRTSPSGSRTDAIDPEGRPACSVRRAGPNY